MHQILWQQIQRDVCDVSRHLRELERMRDAVPGEWTRGDQKYFDKLIETLDELTEAQDELDVD